MKDTNLMPYDIRERVLKEAKQRGIRICVNGRPYDPDKPEEFLLALEEAVYMADYIGNEEGDIIQISFDKIKE